MSNEKKGKVGAMITIKGKVFEVGLIANGRGFQMEVDGEEVAITGLTEEECQKVAPLIGCTLEISINQVDKTDLSFMPKEQKP